MQRDMTSKITPHTPIDTIDEETGTSSYRGGGEVHIGYDPASPDGDESRLVIRYADGRIEVFVRESKLIAERQRGEEALRAVREQLREFAQAVIEADKTKRYEYSRKDCDRNALGKLPEEPGSRWSTPKEMAQAKLRYLDTLTNNPPKK